MILEYVPSDSRVANILTKIPAKGKNERNGRGLELVKNTFLAEREY